MGRRKEEIRIIPLSELPLTNDFMFGEVMSREEICILFLEELLGKKIDHIEYIERQQDITDGYESHGIRLDVYLEDEKGTVYNIEMQQFSGDKLEMRVRYYQSGIDRRTLEKGVHYEDLRDSYVIFVCAFDYFGTGSAVYEKESFMRGEGESLIPYEDGSHVIFLNSKYKVGNASEAILEYLDYMRSNDGTKAYRSELVKKVKDAVEDVRQDKTKEERYMTLTMKLEDMRRAGFREGKEEGKEEGKAEGQEEMALNNVGRLVDKEGWSVEKACEILGLPAEMRAKIEKELL